MLGLTFAERRMALYLRVEANTDSGGTYSGGGGGGVPGTPSGSTTPQQNNAPFPVTENGGVTGNYYVLFVPVQNQTTNGCNIFSYDLSNYNDPVDGSSFSYRCEDIKLHRVPTVRRVILVYRDIGQCNITITLTAVNDNQTIVTASQGVTLGNASPTFQLMTMMVDISLTGYRPRLSISRAAGAGSLAIVSATMCGEIEETTL